MSSGALAQRRHAHADDRERGSRGPRGNALAATSARRSRLVAATTRTSTRCVVRCAADRPHRPLVERAQQRRLQLERQLADLVEEERAAVGLREGAAAIGDRAGERALARGRTAPTRSARRGTAPQSNTTNGPSLRGEWLWISSAISSLPVPVSPSISTVASVAATSSSSRNSRRILGSRPTSEPKLSCSDGARSTSSSSGRNLSTVLPSLISAPKPSVSSLKREPWTNEPLVEPRSRSTTTWSDRDRCRGACARSSGRTAAHRSRRPSRP